MEVAEQNVQLPPVPNKIAEQPLQDNPNSNCASALPVINTDDLPITPLRNKKWLNTVAIAPCRDSSKTQVLLNTTPLLEKENEKSTSFENLGNTSNEVNSISLPNTDNLLDISVPKTTLLGKEQAKKRLHAFSLAKQNSLSISPLQKKNLRQPKFLLQPAEDKYNENGERTDEKFVLIKKPARKSVNPNAKAKAVIEEIEEIKKIESAYLEALEQGLLDSRYRRSKSRSKSREKHKRRSRREHRRSHSIDTSKPKKSWAKAKYPASWAEVKAQGYDFETLVNMKAKEYRSRDECSDFRKQLLFETPSLPLHRLTFKGLNGKEKIIPAEYVRFTNKMPKVSYSVKEKAQNDYYSRKCVLQYVSKPFRDIIKKIATHSTASNELESPPRSTTRKWFPKGILSKLDNSTECTILETSLGLSFLQNYSDEEELDKEENIEDNNVNMAQSKLDDTQHSNTEEVEQIESKMVVEESQEVQALEIKTPENISRTEDLKPQKKVKSESSEGESKKAVKKREKVKKKHKKEKKKSHIKTKKGKHKKKKVKRAKEAKERKSQSSDALDDNKKESDKHKKCDNKKADDCTKIKTEIDNRDSKKTERNRSRSSDAKDHRTRSSSKEETFDKTRTKKVPTHSSNQSVNEELKKKESEPRKLDNVTSDNSVKEKSVKMESQRKDLTKDKHEKESTIETHVREKSKEKYNYSRRESTERKKSDRKQRSRSRERTSKKSKSRSNKSALTTTVKCIAEKEFGTPDTEEYYSNWESDVELTTNLTKRSEESLNQSSSINQSWETDDEPVASSRMSNSDLYLDMPLAKSPFRIEKSPSRSQQNRDKSVEPVLREKRTYRKDKSPDRNRTSERRSSLKDRSLDRSPMRARVSDAGTRSRHLDSFPMKISPIRSEYSPAREKFSPIRSEFSPFRSRCIEERRRSRRSLERSPPPRVSAEPYLEMPLNIRNSRRSYSRSKWEEERFEGSKYSRSPDHIEFSMHMPSENKMYALYAEDSWERDDYLTIKTEEIRLEEERRTLIEERRKLEIEKRKLEELERQRYYSHMSEMEDDRCSIQKEKEDRYNAHRGYHESRDIQTYSKENDLLSRRATENQRIRRKYSSEKSQEKVELRERLHEGLSWEDSRESKRNVKLPEGLSKEKPALRRRRSRWQDIDDTEPLPESFIRDADQQSSAKEASLHTKNESAHSRTEQKAAEREKRIARKNRWESSEDEIVHSRDEKKPNSKVDVTKVQSKQRFVNKSKCIKEERHKERKNKEHSLTNTREIKYSHEKDSKGTVPQSAPDLSLSQQKVSEAKTNSQASQKPEVLENEYEKFMQALTSEISAAEDISENDNQKKARAGRNLKFVDKRVKRRKSRSASASSDEELEKVSKREVKVRKIKKKKKRVSSSSSSSTSSSSSDSDSSSESSSTSSSSDSSASSRNKRRLKKPKLQVIKIKNEKEDVHDKVVEMKTKSSPSNINSLDAVDTRNVDKELKTVIKVEDIDVDLKYTGEVGSVELTNYRETPVSSSKSLNTSVNLNIINISMPEFSLGEIPLPGSELQKPVLQSSFAEIPLPVPSPKIAPAMSKSDQEASKLDSVVLKVEPITLTVDPHSPFTLKDDTSPPKSSSLLQETSSMASSVSADVSVLPDTPQMVVNSSEFSDSMKAHLNTSVNIHADADMKAEPVPQEEKMLVSPVQGNTMASPASPAKRNNLIPIKFLTAELRKQANESPNLKPFGLIDLKSSVLCSGQAASESKASETFDKTDRLEALPLANRNRYFALSSINLSTKHPLFDDPVQNENSNSADFTDRFIRRDGKEGKEEVSTSTTTAAAEQPAKAEVREQADHQQILKNHSPLQNIKEQSAERERRSRASPDHSRERRKRSLSPKRKRDVSPRSSRRSSRSPWRQSPKRRAKDVSPRRREREMSPRGQRNMSPRGQRNMSPRRWDYDGSPRRVSRDGPMKRVRDASVRRNSVSPRRRSISPKRKETRQDLSISPKRKETRRDLRSISPRDAGVKRRFSPRQRSQSPKRRSTSREFSPRRHRSKERSPSKFESIQETLQRIAGVDRYSSLPKQSPLSSPLHGFKRSVADSTISDDQLLQRNLQEYTGSPSYSSEYFKSVTNAASVDSSSPKRMSLDERINQALGLEQPKPIGTTYSSNYEYDQQYFEQYGQYYDQYNEQNRKSGACSQLGHGFRQARQRESSNLKVVQVGNVLQVVPTEEAQKQPPIQKNKVTNSTPKIVQVGNMLQIVPTATLPEKPEAPMSAPAITLPGAAPPFLAPPPPAAPATTVTKETLSVQALIKQKVEWRAEKDKRRQERERKRKEKERKKKEREKRKQMKLKLHTEAMIKQALILDTEETSLGDEENNAEGTNEPVQWPPIPQVILNNSYKPAGKGILLQVCRGSLTKGEEGELEPPSERRKSVKFSDGVAPGEGTSPSGGEELSSPPPAPTKLPKEKRFKKTKIPKKAKAPKKKKVKVKVIRQQQIQGPEDDDDDEEDNLPPPPPPPGSPPPHLFPARIKQHVINNVHPNIAVSIANLPIANPPLQATDTSYPPPPVYRPGVPVIMSHHGHHHGPPPMPPHGPPHGHHHHPPPGPPCRPPHHGGFNPPPVIMPPVIVPSLPNFGPPRHPPPHHGGHHHHSHSPHHGHHHH